MGAFIGGCILGCFIAIGSLLIANLKLAGTLTIGALSDWISGLATLAAVIIAIIAIYGDQQRFQAAAERERGLWEAEQTRLAMEVRAKAREDLGRIFCWVSTSDDPITGRALSTWLTITNATNLPIYDWTVNNDKSLLASSVIDGPLLPGAKSVEYRIENFSEVRPQIEFRVASGELLRRSASGELVLVEE
jgi:hypothetical protein